MLQACSSIYVTEVVQFPLEFMPEQSTRVLSLKVQYNSLGKHANSPKLNVATSPRFLCLKNSSTGLPESVQYDPEICCTFLDFVLQTCLGIRATFNKQSSLLQLDFSLSHALSKTHEECQK
jgi:hypothetical protein